MTNVAREISSFFIINEILIAVAIIISMNACYETYFPYEVNPTYTWKVNEAHLLKARHRRNAIACIAIGVIGSLGGMFLLFASSQVLPNGVNAMSGLGVGGKVIGGIILGSGVLTAVYGLMRYCGTCKAANRSSAPNQNKQVPIQYTQEEARAHFDILISRYDSIVARTAGCGKRVQTIIDVAWDELDAFAQAYPEFRSEIPKKATQYDDGQDGLTGALSAYGGAISHYDHSR